MFNGPYSFEQTLRDNAAANQGLLTVTVANWAHLKLTLNWVENLRRHKITPFVFCVDRKMAGMMSRRNISAALIPSEWLPENLSRWRNITETQAESKFDTPDYIFITHFKAPVLRYLMLQGYHVLFSDVDIAFIRPGLIQFLLEKRAANPKRAFLFYTLEQPDPNFQVPYLNSGLYFVTPSPYAVTFWARLMAQQAFTTTEMDQFAFNRVLDSYGYKRSPGRLAALGECEFPNGDMYFNGFTPCPKELVPYAAHANYMVGRDTKENALRNISMWFLPDDVDLS